MTTATRDRIDFGAIKERVSLQMAAQYLGLQLKQANGQLRGRCPVHSGGDDRSFVITPDKGFTCHVERLKEKPRHEWGGDQIQLVAHVRQVANHEAAKLLSDHFAISPARQQQASSPKPHATSEGEPKALDYLVFSPEVEGLGISEVTCAAWGAGYAPQGTMRGRFLVPLRHKDGSYYAVDGKVQYVGIAMNDKQMPRFQLDPKCRTEDIVFGASHIEGDEVRLARDPLAVLQLADLGEAAICFLNETVDAQQIEFLASVLDAKKCKLFF